VRYGCFAMYTTVGSTTPGRVDGGNVRWVLGLVNRNPGNESRKSLADEYVSVKISSLLLMSGMMNDRVKDFFEAAQVPN